MFYLINKEKGISSFKTIKNFANLNNIKKIGHTGTLDPLAQGLLLIATDEDTAFIEYIDKKNKTYVVKMQLGFSSPTYDTEAEITNHGCDHNHTKEEIITTIENNFLGTFFQIPPVFSAKKVNGKRSYEIAKQNINFQLKPQKVSVDSYKFIDYDKNNIITLEFTVSRGTYIRSLVVDIAKVMNCHAVMTFLDRTKIGDLSSDKSFQEIYWNELLFFPILDLDKEKTENIFNGKVVEFITKNNFYMMTYKSVPFGFCDVIDNKIKSKKIIGNKLIKLLND